MNPNHTDITVVLDRSGSMTSVADDTIGGFNRFLEDQKKAPGTAAITLHQFNTIVFTTLQTSDVKHAAPLTRETFVPHGNTALFDALGASIKDTGKRLESMPEAERPGKVVFVILTDGEENASRLFNRAQVFEMITHQREKYAWEFVFLGANQDAIKAGAMIGINKLNSMSYAHNSKGTESAFASMSSSLRSYRAGDTKCASFTDADRDAQLKAGLAPTP